jgi:glycosyltransferase involved in cell wall biosynthesis
MEPNSQLAPKKGKDVQVSVLICTYNRSTSLRQTLESLARVRVPETLRSELLVVDNSSTDSTEQVVRSIALPNMTARYLREPRRGKGYAYNTGIAAAQGDILICTDDDVRLPNNWIEGMCAPILSGRAHAVQGGVTLGSHLERPWLTKELRWLLACTDGLSAEPLKWAVGANLAFSKEVLAKVPGFDPELGTGALGAEEESLFFRQLVRAGYRVATALEVAVEHHCDEKRLTRSSFLNTARYGGRSLAYFEFHWQHVHLPSPRWQLAKLLLKLARYRVRAWREVYRKSIPTWDEIVLVKQIEFYRQYLIERKRPRNYEKYGLMKLSHATR